MPVNNGNNSSISSAGIGSGPDPGGGELPEGGGGALDGGGVIIDPFELEEWEIVEFTDPRDSSVYDIIDGRVIIAFKDPPDIPLMDPNYFDVERDPETDPYYPSITYSYEVTQTVEGLTQVYDPEIAAFLAAENLTVYSEWPMVAGMAVVLPEGQTVADAVANWPGEYPELIEAVDADAIGETCQLPLAPIDEGFAFQWYLQDDDLTVYGLPPWRYSADIVTAWTQGQQGSHIRVVAVLDTGVDWQSRDLKSTSTDYGANTGDNGKYTQFLPRSAGGGEPWAFLMDRSQAHASALGHGTCVAGVLAATLNNDELNTPLDDRDIVGAAPGCKYFPVAIKAKGLGNPPQAVTSLSATLHAITVVGSVKRLPGYEPQKLFPFCAYVPYHNVEVVNMSLAWKSAGNRVGDRHLNYLGEFTLFVAAAGNKDEGARPYWPACSSMVMAVAAHDSNGFRSVWEGGEKSNHQQYIDISAPGTALWSCDMVGTTSCGYYRGYKQSPIDVRTDFGGTSGASPIVAGVAALVTSKWPSLWPQMVRSRINATASHDLPDPLVNQFGRVDAGSAL